MSFQGFHIHLRRDMSKLDKYGDGVLAEEQEALFGPLPLLGHGHSHSRIYDNDVEIPPEPTLLSLFAFTTSRHLPLLITALFFAIASGFTLPIMTVVFGRIFGIFISYSHQSEPGRELLSGISREAAHLAYLGCGALVVNSIFYGLWDSFGELQAKRARGQVFEGLIGRKLSWFEGKKPNVTSLLSRTQMHIRELQAAASGHFGLAVNNSGCAAASFALAFSQSWKLSSIVLCLLPLTYVFIRLLSRGICESIEERKESLARASRTAARAVFGIDTVKAFNAQDIELKKFEFCIEEAAHTYRVQASSEAAQEAVFRFFILATFIHGFWYGSRLFATSELSAEQVVTIFWACLMGAQALEELHRHLRRVQKGRQAGAALKALVLRISRDRTTPDFNAKRYPITCIGQIKLTDVSFAYPSRPDKLAIDNISISFPAAQLTFVIGRNGSGKSTLGSLITQLYEPTSGNISIDGYSSKVLDPRWIRDNISILHHASVLFNETIFRNITFGRRDFDFVTRGDVRDVCKYSTLDGALDRLPLGIDTTLTLGGSSLSGGERQRIALAREMLRDARILIIDEGLSALDAVSRQFVMQCIRTWRKGKTTIVITHDISDVELNDFCYVMDTGRVAQSGYRRDLEKNEHGLLHSFIEAVKIYGGPYEPRTNGRSHSERNCILRVPDVGDPDEPPLLSPMDGRLHLLYRLELLPLFAGVWRALPISMRLQLACAIVLSLAHAAALPIFSFLLSKLLGSMVILDASVARISAWILGVVILDALATYGMLYLVEKCAEKWVDSNRYRAFRAVLAQPREWFDLEENSAARIVTDLEQSAERMRDYLGIMIGNVVVAYGTMTIGLSWSFFISWRLSFVGMLISPIILRFAKFLKHINEREEQKTTDKANEAAAILNDCIASIRTVRNLALENYFRRKYFAAIGLAYDRGLIKALHEGLAFGGSDSMVFFAMSILFYVGAVIISLGMGDLEQVMAVFSIMLFSLSSGQAVLENLPQLSGCLDAARRLHQLVNLPDSSHEKRGILPVEDGNIEFRGATFSYLDGHPVLLNFNLTINPGEFVCITGNSGHGKSTIANLLLRLYQLKVGAINIADAPISHLSVISLRSHITIVPQTPLLFPVSIRDNISYGLDPETVPLALVVAAAKAVGLHDDIRALPGGYATVLAADGSGLSAGQTQRLAIARGLIRSTRVLILDEPTNGLDAESARTVRDTIRGLRGVTRIVITHACDMISVADRVVEIKDGQAVEKKRRDKKISPKLRLVMSDK